MASLKVQQRFIVSGTKDHYLLPEEILEDAQAAAARWALSPDLTARQRTVIQNAAIIFRREGSRVDLGTGTSHRQLIEDDPSWAAIREAAGTCLEALGFDLLAWERRELE